MSGQLQQRAVPYPARQMRRIVEAFRSMYANAADPPSVTDPKTLDTTAPPEQGGEHA